MDLLTPEELEQAILAPIQSPLCSELMSKLLLKKSSSRRELPPGEGYPFIKWSELLNKQLLSWHRIYQKYQKDQNTEKCNTASKLIIKMFTDMNGNPFYCPSSQKTEETPQPKQVSGRVRETRSQTNSLPRTKKYKYAEEFLEQSSDIEEDDEKFLNLGEIPVAKRVLFLYYLCVLKLETEEEMLHELNYVPIEQQNIQPIGKDNAGGVYFYFNNIDCRVYKSYKESFTLVAKTIDQVKELILYLQNSGVYEFSRFLNSMMEEFVKNEQERSKKLSNSLRKIHILAGKKNKVNDFEYEDSDFSPIEDDDIPRKRGPGRPRKNPLPETKPKVMPETTGNDLIMRGKLKKITATGEVFYNFTGKWELDEKNSQSFSFLKKNEGEAGIYIGTWQFFSKPIDETFCIEFHSKYVTGSGENMFGIFQITGD